MNAHTSQQIKPNGKVDLWDMGPADADAETHPEKAAERAAWMKRFGGPFKVELFAVDAKHALAVEPDRFKFKLPKGTGPGEAQREADERAARAAAEEQEQPDPYFTGAAKP